MHRFSEKLIKVILYVQFKMCQKFILIDLLQKKKKYKPTKLPTNRTILHKINITKKSTSIVSTEIYILNSHKVPLFRFSQMSMHTNFGFYGSKILGKY